MSEPGEEAKEGGSGFFRTGYSDLLAQLKKNWKAVLICAVLVGGVGDLLEDVYGRKLQEWSYDLSFRMRGPIFPGDVAGVWLDEDTHKVLGLKYGKLIPRERWAQVLDVMTKQHAKGVVLDVVLTDPGDNPAADDILAKAIAKNGKVILAADLRPTDTEGNQVAGYEFDAPYNPFYNAAGGDDRTASDRLIPDDDQIIRRYLSIDPTNDMFASEAWAAAAMVNAPITRNITNKYTPFYINYYGPSKVIPGFSMADVLGGQTPTNFFAGKMVFVGEKLQTQLFGERKDQYPTPFSYLTPDTPYSGGVEIHATAFLNLAHNESLMRMKAIWEWLILAILGGALFGSFLTLLRPLAATITAIAVAAGLTGLNYFLFTREHIWFAWEIMALVQIPIALIYSIAYNSVQLYVEKQKVEQSLALYLSPKMVKKLARDPKLLKPGAEKQILTILFTDIASFTSISEGMEGDELAHSMNAYFQVAVHNCIHPTDGTVVKYIGDAIFAFWNAPEWQADHAYRACEAAMLFCEQPPQHMNNKELITRLGLHTGVANVGNFGSMARVDYTALGENINLASRMEGLNKYLGTRVLLTGETQAAAGPKVLTRYLGMFRLKGFEKAVDVYELMGRTENAAATSEVKARFAEALRVFATKDFAKAEAAFRRVLEIAPGDGPAKFYLEQLEELSDTELPADWKGEITLKEK